MTRDWWGRYVGAPFEDGGRGPDSYDCWGLLRAVYSDVRGVTLPTYGEVSSRDLLKIARAIDAGKDEGWEACEPAPMVAVLMRSGRGGPRIVHVGVMVDSRRMLHTEVATHAALVPINHPSVSGRIVGFRRLVP